MVERRTQSFMDGSKKKKRKEKNNLFENLEKYKQVTGDYTKTIESE